MKQQKLKFDSLTSANWMQFETLMGEKGGCGNCWCMYFRLPYKDFQENKPDGNKKMIKQYFLVLLLTYVEYFIC